MTTAQQRTIHGCEVIRKVGSGGMASVYLAYQHDLKRHVALKELSSLYSADSKVVERFLLESRLAASLNHPNIVTVHQFFEHDGVPYIAMEYLARGSLRPYLDGLPFAQFVGVMEGIFAGLDHAASHGIVHRDMKPENLMVTDDGRVKITDFGIAKATATSGLGTYLTKDGMTVGTPNYMAPEQAVASKDIGPWTDLYSVGIIAYEYLTGRPPFADCAAAVVLFRQVNEPVPPAVEVNPQVDPQISDWVDRLLAKDPRERTRSATAAWDELEDIAVRRVGPLWRRQARLPSPTLVPAESRPLTPAEFRGHTSTFAGSAPPEPLDSSYVTFTSGRSPGPSESTAAPRRVTLCGEVQRLCAALDRETSGGEPRRGLHAIRRDLAAEERRPRDSHLDATHAAEALRRIEELPWGRADLRVVTDRIEELQEKGAEMQLVKLARWWMRCEDGGVALPPDKLEELGRLLSAATHGERLGLGDSASNQDVRAAARERALAWRTYEGSAPTSPMARRVAADVVRFYEEVASAAERGER